MFKISPDAVVLLLISAFGSFVSVMLRPFGSKLQTLGHFLAGTFVAFVFTNPIIKFFDIDKEYAGAIGAVLGMCGAGFARVVIEASQNPEKARGLAKILVDIFDVITGRGGRS